jgi:predicted HTH transcriptional regulator
LPNPELLIKEFWSLINNTKKVKKVNKNILKKKDINIQNLEGKRIITINVPRAKRQDRPIFIDGDIKLGSYRRNGEGDYRCTEQEIAAMLRDASFDTYDKRILKNMELTAIDKNSVREFERIIKRRVDLIKMGALSYDQRGQLRPTAGGLLLFGYVSEILKEFPNFYLHYLEIKNKIHIDYSVDELNVIEFYSKISGIIDDNIDLKFKNIAREALANCLIHADYYGTRGLLVIKSDNQINFSNPGSFRPDMEMVKKRGLSEPRNLIIMNAFKEMGVGKNRGKSIKHICDATENYYITEEFNPDRTITTIVTNENIDILKENCLRKKVISHITNCVFVKEDDLISRFGYDLDGLRLVLNSLLDEQLLIKDKNSNYSLLH